MPSLELLVWIEALQLKVITKGESLISNPHSSEFLP